MSNCALLVIRWPVGGIRTYVRDLLRSDAFADITFRVIVPSCDETRSLMDEVSRPDVNWQLTANSSSALARAVWTLRDIRSCSLLHSHGFTAACVTGPAAVLHHLPHLVTGHDVLVDGQLRGAKGFAWRTLLQAILAGADRIHCVTHQARDNLLQYLPRLRARPQRLSVIKHGIDVSHFANSPRRDLHAELGVSAQTRLIGFLGRFMSQKGFPTLVAAVALLAGCKRPLPDFRIVVVSYGGYIREEQERIAGLGLSRYFVFLDFVADAAPTVKGLDLLVMPSLWEASGLLAMESLVCGTPLIGTSCIGLRETLEDSPALLVAPGDAAGLAAAIEQRLLYDGREEAERFVATAASRFDGRAAFRALRGLYDETAAARRQ